ncbi:unnamed protein product, partial [Pleuronectes platessa]
GLNSRDTLVRTSSSQLLGATEHTAARFPFRQWTPPAGQQKETPASNTDETPDARTTEPPVARKRRATGALPASARSPSGSTTNILGQMISGESQVFTESDQLTSDIGPLPMSADKSVHP